MKFKEKFDRLIHKTVPAPVYYNEQFRESYSSCSVSGNYHCGKLAVVTGGASGIGFAIAQRLLNEGCNVIITGRNKEKMISAINDMHYRDNQYVDYSLIDQLNEESVIKGCNEILKKYEVDYWINSAGIITEMDRKRRFVGTNKKDFHDVMNTNFKSVSLACKIVYESMNAGKGGKILNIASLAGLLPSFGYTAYGMSKCAVVNFAKSYQLKNVNNKVSMISVAPGVVVTRMSDYKFGENIANNYNVSRHTIIPEEISALVTFLLSPIGQYMNGETIEASSNESLFLL